MKKIALISCCKRKKSSRCLVKDMYVSESFFCNLELAENIGVSEKYVISAKHGLLEMEEEIEPYDLHIGELSKKECIKWKNGVLNRLREMHDLNETKFFIFADEDYSALIAFSLPYCEVVLKR